MTTLPLDDDGEFTELFDANLPRADMVRAPAHGWPGWLVMKGDEGAAGLLDPDFVRDLIKQAAPQDTTGGLVPDSTATREREQVVTPNGLTLTGSPAALAAFIHKAALGAHEDAPAEFYEQVVKAKYSADDKRKMLAAGHAIKNENGDPAYPIGDKDDLGKAVQAVGRGGPEHDHIRAYVIRRAKALGASSEIPGNWNADGSLKQPVSKEEEPPVATVAKDLMDAAGDAAPLDDGMDGLDPTVPLATPDDEDVPGDPTDPGSPAWESIDAATAMKWTAILARAQYAIGLLAEREMLEAASADPGDAENACDLAAVCDAIDYSISVLAPFAVGEQSEADCGAMEMQGIEKAAGMLRPGDIKVIETFAAVKKAGRVLSSANEAAIRGAVDSLQKVLASLPEAPVAKSDTKEAAMPAATTTTSAPQAVAKETAVTATPEDQARNSGPVNAGGTTGMGQPRATGPDAALPGDGPQAALPGDMPGRKVIKGLAVLVYDRAGRPCVTGLDAISTDIAKADASGGDGRPSMQAVFDANGNLVGVVDPDAITPVAGTTTAPGDSAEPQPAAPAPAPDADDSGDDDDMEPQPSADAGTPADAVGKSATSPKEARMEDVLKGIADAQAAFAAQQAQYLEAVTKAVTAGSAAQAEEITALKSRLANVEAQPAPARVFSNGQRPPDGDRPAPAAQLRGQDLGGAQVDVTKALARKQEFYQAPDARQQDQIAKGMQSDAIAALAAVHGAGPRKL